MWTTIRVTLQEIAKQETLAFLLLLLIILGGVAEILAVSPTIGRDAEQPLVIFGYVFAGVGLLLLGMIVTRHVLQGRDLRSQARRCSIAIASPRPDQHIDVGTNNLIHVEGTAKAWPDSRFYSVYLIRRENRGHKFYVQQQINEPAGTDKWSGTVFTRVRNEEVKTEVVIVQHAAPALLKYYLEVATANKNYRNSLKGRYPDLPRQDATLVDYEGNDMVTAAWVRFKV